MLTQTQIIKAILASLDPSLLTAQYRAALDAQSPPEAGHCAVATEAFYYLAGGKEAGFMPVVCGYDTKNGRETHWWLRGPAHGQRGKGAVIDITAAQFAKPFPYERGHNVGFMQPQQKPSKRAQIVMDRVAEKLGGNALEAFRRRSIQNFAAAAKPQSRKHHGPSP